MLILFLYDLLEEMDAYGDMQCMGPFFKLNQSGVQILTHGLIKCIISSLPYHFSMFI